MATNLWVPRVRNRSQVKELVASRGAFNWKRPSSVEFRYQSCSYHKGFLMTRAGYTIRNLQMEGRSDHKGHATLVASPNQTSNRASGLFLLLPMPCRCKHEDQLIRGLLFCVLSVLSIPVLKYLANKRPTDTISASQNARSE